MPPTTPHKSGSIHCFKAANNSIFLLFYIITFLYKLLFWNFLLLKCNFHLTSFQIAICSFAYLYFVEICFLSVYKFENSQITTSISYSKLSAIKLQNYFVLLFNVLFNFVFTFNFWYLIIYVLVSYRDNLYIFLKYK